MHLAFQRYASIALLLTLGATVGAPVEASCETAGNDAASCRAASPPAGRADFAILITLHLTAAEMHCPYRIEEGRLRRLLNHHGLALGEAYTRPRSAQLSAEFEKIIEGFRADRQRACEIAWKHFGPAATFEGFLQPR